MRHVSSEPHTPNHRLEEHGRPTLNKLVSRITVEAGGLHGLPEVSTKSNSLRGDAQPPCSCGLVLVHQAVDCGRDGRRLVFLKEVAGREQDGGVER
jgi:hypothetical protein